MAKRIKNRTLFHVTETKPYKVAFGVGQTVTVGQQVNPFFGFYENAREYAVTDSNTGGVLQVKAVRWLKAVRDKQINPHADALPNIAADVVQHYVMLCRELIMEEIRAKEFRSAPSRQKCLYVCETLDEARSWRTRTGPAGMICELRCTGKTLRADAALLLGDSEPLSVTRDRARKYWRGDASENPEWETLFAGEVAVTKIGL